MATLSKCDCHRYLNAVCDQCQPKGVGYDSFFCPECKIDLIGNNHAAGCPLLPERAAGGEKLSNPKDIIGSDKVPLSIVPGTTKAYLAIGHLEGMLKYGYVNWRVAGVRTSIYLDALERHIEKFKNGEWADEETKVPHLANALACLSILVDAHECGKLTDDRPKQAPVAGVLTKLAENVKHLKKLFGHCNPHHYLHEK
jgi:hypothetical protein